jgi:hypothetical protein
MNALLVTRVQSAYSRPSHRSGIDGQDSHIKPRPKTSKSTRQSYTNEFDQRTLKSSSLSSATSHRPRSKTAGSSAKSASRKLRPDEIENLLQSLDHDDSAIVQIDCLADYRTLVQTIDLRKTPIDCKLLCALQQRENRIVQGNACHDIRFRSLIELLQPAYVPGEIEQNDLDEDNQNPVLEYPHNNIPDALIK